MSREICDVVDLGGLVVLCALLKFSDPTLSLSSSLSCKLVLTTSNERRPCHRHCRSGVTSVYVCVWSLATHDHCICAGDFKDAIFDGDVHCVEFVASLSSVPLSHYNLEIRPL